MNQSKRGAARVSVVWVIASGVLALVALAFGFVQHSDLGQARDDLAAAEQAKVDADTRYDELSQTVRSIAQAVGWYDRESANPRTDVDAVESSLSSLKDAFSDLGEGVADIEQAIPIVIAAYNTRGQEITDLRNRVKEMQGEVEAARESERQVARAKDAELAQLRSELADATDTAASRVNELERRVNQLSEQSSELDLELRRERQQMLERERAHEKELARLRARLDQLGSDLAFKLPGNADLPDGEVLAVSDRLNLGWINLGTRDRVARGMRFRVESPDPGSRRFKAWAEVLNAKPDTAEVIFTQQADPFDPVVTGDVLINPLYDPDGGRNAVLVGRFDATYNENEVRALLRDIGIHVQPKLDNTTHYLIVGSEIWMDEDGEPLEEPLQPSDLPVYREAEAIGVQIVPLQNVREFFSVRRG